MSDREELRATAAQCLALARSVTDSCKRITLTGMAQKLYEMAGDTVREFDRAQQEFNDRQMLPPRWAQPEAPMQQQQQIQPTEK